MDALMVGRFFIIAIKIVFLQKSKGWCFCPMVFFEKDRGFHGDAHFLCQRNQFLFGQMWFKKGRSRRQGRSEITVLIHRQCDADPFAQTEQLGNDAVFLWREAIKTIQPDFCILKSGRGSQFFFQQRKGGVSRQISFGEEFLITAVDACHIPAFILYAVGQSFLIGHGFQLFRCDTVAEKFRDGLSQTAYEAVFVHHMTEIRQVIPLFQQDFLQCHLLAYISQYDGSVQSVFGKELVCQSAEAEDFRCQDTFAFCPCCQVTFRLRGVLLRHQKNLPSFVGGLGSDNLPHTVFSFSGACGTNEKT